MDTMAIPIAVDDAASNLTDFLAKQPLHPYYPLGVELPQYAANKDSVPYLLGIFFSVCTVLFTATFYLARRISPHLSRAELASIMWFMLSGCIHMFFEGYYVSNFIDLASKQTLIGQMWKEYAFSDSRYLTSNAFVLCMESITAIMWGPGCILCAGLMMKRHPARWATALIISVGQVYGKFA